MSIEAMRLALDALQDPWKSGPDGVASAITALRAAIEQAEKPGVNGDAVEWLCERCNCIYPMQRHGLVQPCPHCKLAMKPTSFNLREIDRLQATITAPRQWVELTDEEIVEMHYEIQVRLIGTYKRLSVSESVLFRSVARAIEAKLKEKNCG